MYLTDVMKKKIEAQLDDLEQMIEWMDSQVEQGEKKEDWTQKLAAERALYIAVELMTNAASDIIDAMVMRDPGGYSDILLVLVEEKILSQSLFEQLLPLIDLRTRLLRELARIPNADIFFALQSQRGYLRNFCKQLRSYMEHPY